LYSEFTKIESFKKFILNIKLMELSTNHYCFIFQENLEGKKEKFLLIKCNNCKFKDHLFFQSQKCIICFLTLLHSIKNEKLKGIKIEKLNEDIKFSQITYIIDYFKNLKKIKNYLLKIKNLRIDICPYKDFKCKHNIPFELINIIIKKLIDPIYFKKKFDEFNLFFNKYITENYDLACNNCIKNIIKENNNIIQIFQSLELFKIINDLNDFNYEIQYPLFLKRLLFNKPILKTNKFEKKGIITDKILLERYTTGIYNIYDVYIYEIPEYAEKYYEVKYNIDQNLEFDYYLKIIQRTLIEINDINLTKIYPLEDLISLYEVNARKFLKQNYNFNNLIIKKLSIIIALKKLNLEKFFFVLIDDFVEEIFLDNPNDFLYLNHQKYGRCRTTISFNERDIERLKTLLRLYSGRRIDFQNPSIKYVIKNKFFFCRFAIDIEPININKYSFDIRKLNKNILTIQDLLKNNTISSKMAAFLYFLILRRINIMVTGETDTGKTTLINALDLLTPLEFRKIYIENISESINQLEFNKHQLKFRANSLESQNFTNTKSNLIKTLLHRSPDIIYLGEILTKEETEAMFHCLAAGLRGFQTIHSRNISSLINRFLYHFKINRSCLSDLDIIILMKKDNNIRRIHSIVEIDKNNLNSNNPYIEIFKYNSQNNNWIQLIPLINTNVINSIRDYHYIDSKKFELIFSLYIKIFKTLREISKKIPCDDLTQLFHKISFYSLYQPNLLYKFWAKQKTRILKTYN